MKKQTVYFGVVFFLACFHTNAQKDLNFDEGIRKLIEGNHNSKDSTTSQQSFFPEEEAITSSGSNEVNNAPVPQQRDANYDDGVTKVKPVETHHQTIQRFRRREPLQMSDEALYWSRYATNSYNRFGSYITYRDTIIINPLFMPPLFKKGYAMPADSVLFYQPKVLTEAVWNNPLYKPAKTLERQALKIQIENMAYRHIQYHKPYIFDYTAESLPSETTRFIRKKNDVKIAVEKKEIKADEIPAPAKFIPDRQYWVSSFESMLKLSENFASENWHKGGTESAILNIVTKNSLQYNYAKDKLKLDNKLEINANLYSAPKDSLHDYKIGDDLLRFYSNLGFKAFDKWHYTFNAELKTQMFTNYRENSTFKQAAFLAPYTINLGLGMEYNYKKQYKRKDRSLVLSVNIAPISYSYMHSINDSIDLGRHGFEKDEVTGQFKNSLSKLGSTIRFDLTVNPNRAVTWKSKFNYFTSYDRVISEFENSLDLAISRYFSTLISLNLRYDDGVTKVNPKDIYLQFNQQLSFGFSYKW